MNMDENIYSDDELQRQYYELKSIDEHMRKLDSEVFKIDQKCVEIDSIKNFLKDISTKSGSDALIPLTDGIFVKAKLLEQGNFIVNIGSNVCVPKSTEETSNLLDFQKSELLKYKEQLILKLETLDKMAQDIEKKFIESKKV